MFLLFKQHWPQQNSHKMKVKVYSKLLFLVFERAGLLQGILNNAEQAEKLSHAPFYRSSKPPEIEE
jgi:hypothetical protein